MIGVSPGVIHRRGIRRHHAPGACSSSDNTGRVVGAPPSYAKHPERTIVEAFQDSGQPDDHLSSGVAHGNDAAPSPTSDTADASSSTEARTASLFAAVAGRHDGSHSRKGAAERKASAASAAFSSAEPADSFEQSWYVWHAAHIDALASPHGYLSPVALTWLSSGDSAEVPLFPGTWHAQDDTIVYEPDAHHLVMNAGRTVARPMSFTARNKGENDLADFDYGDLRVEVRSLPGAFIGGAPRFWLRLKNPHSITRRRFFGVPHYRPNPDWVLPAHFTPCDKARVTRQESVEPSVFQLLPVIGTVDFEYRGAGYSLEVVDDHGTPTVFFADATSGHETYGNGRILEFGQAAACAIDRIDFNRAYNFPCAFTPYCTCPVPRRENRLPFHVTAGERTPFEAQGDQSEIRGTAM